MLLPFIVFDHAGKSDYWSFLSWIENKRQKLFNKGKVLCIYVNMSSYWCLHFNSSPQRSLSSYFTLFICDYREIWLLPSAIHLLNCSFLISIYNSFWIVNLYSLVREHYQSKYIAYVKCPMVKFIDSFIDYSFPKLLTIISPLIISFQWCLKLSHSLHSFSASQH